MQKYAIAWLMQTCGVVPRTVLSLPSLRVGGGTLVITRGSMAPMNEVKRRFFLAVFFTLCCMLVDCTSVAHPVSGPEMVAQDGPEVTYAEVREACERPAYRTRARHTPVYTERGYAVWCY